MAGAEGVWPQAGAGAAGGCGVAAGCGAATGGGVGAASSSTETPKSVAMPARPLAYPWPTARTFHTPPRWYTSTTTSAVSVPSFGGVKVAITAPPSASRTVAVGSTPWKDCPAASGLAVTTTRSMPCGSAPVSTVIESGAEPPPDR